MGGRRLWAILGICISTNALWAATCTQSGNNDLTCPNVTNDLDSYEYTLTENKNLSGAINVSGGNLVLNFAPSVTNLTSNAILIISGGVVSINCEDEASGNCKDSNANFSVNNGGISVRGGTFKSAFVINSSTNQSTNGISISGGNFIAGALQNNGIFTLSSGSVNLQMLENNKGNVNISGGKSDIKNLINNSNFTISNGTNAISTLSNQKGIATISGGTNTISTLSNSIGATLSITNGIKNDITSFYNSGTAKIKGGTNNFTATKSAGSKDCIDDNPENCNSNITASGGVQNSGTLTISDGKNTFDNLQNTKTLIISGGTNNITNLLNTANLTIQNSPSTTIKNYFENRSGGTLDLKTGANLKLDSGANLNNYGTITGGGTFSGGIFNHYGKFENFSGIFSTDLTFNNMSNLTIKSSGGDLATLNVKNFANYYSNSNSKLILESTLTTSGFTNSTLANFVVKSGGTLTVNTGGTQTITCTDNTNCACPSGQTTCTIALTAQNAGGFFTLENGGKVNSQIDFSNTGYLIIEGGEFSATTLKNQANGVIQLKDGTIKGNVENLNGNFTMSGGTIATLINNSNFALSGGIISGAITNEGGSFAIYSGITSGTFTNKVQEIPNKDKDDKVTSTTYKGANLVIYGTANIDSLTNQSQSADGKKYNSVISIEGGSLESGTLTNSGLIQALHGSLNATNLLNNSGGEIVAYSGGSITAQTFQWGNGVVRYINGNSGLLELKTINNIIENSKLNIDFSSSPIVFGKEYSVIKTNSSSATNFTITSNVKSNLKNPNNLKFSKIYKDGYIVISAEIENTNASLNTLLTDSALQTLGKNTAQFDALKSIDSSEVLSHIISNPQKVATDLQNSNESVATNHTKNSHLNLANSLNTLNRLNKSTTPRKLALGDLVRPTYNFALKRTKNPLIRFANFSDNLGNSSELAYTMEDYKKDYDEEVEAAKLKYNQLIDYENNLYASIFGIFGDFGGTKTNAYGLIAGYDSKITDALILGTNLSYANANKAHNIGIGGYGRAFLLNNEIDFSLNFNYALNDYKTQIFGYTQSAKFSSFGLNANLDYGYLFNVYKSQFFKPFGGLNFYYALTPSYKESGKYGRAIDSEHSFEMSVDLGAEYRIFLKRNQYLYAQVRFEQFIVNLSNGLNMSFVGDSTKFELAKYRGYKNYLQFLVGGDFAVIKDMLNITANVGYKMTVAKSSVDGREIGERYISASMGVKYLF